MLARSRLQVRLVEVDAPLEAFDTRLAVWLAESGGGQGGLLSLSDGQIAEFLDSLVGHSRVEVESQQIPVTVSDDAMPPLPLADSSLVGGEVVLSLGEDPGTAVPWIGGVGILRCDKDEWHIGKLPADSPGEAWERAVRELVREGRVSVSVESFVAHLDAWLDLLPSEAPGWLASLRFQSAELEAKLSVEGSLNALQGTLGFRYGKGEWETSPGRAAEKADLPRVDGEGHVLARSRDAERRWAEGLQAAGWEEVDAGELRMRDPDRILGWIADELPELRRRGVVEVGPRLEHVLGSVHVVAPTVAVDGPGSLSCEISFQANDGRRLSPQRVREILRSGRRSVKTREGAVVVVRSEIRDLVEPLLSDLGIVPDDARIPINRAQGYLFTKLQEKLSENVDNECLKDTAGFVVPTGFQGHLRGYQQEGCQWLSERLKQLSGALLADEMGLGKTVQTIALISHLNQESGGFRALLLVPTTLLGNWRAEFARFAPSMSLVCLHGPGRDRLREDAGAATVVLTSYGTFCRDRAFHLGQEYDLVVCDEASVLKNPSSDVSRSLAKLPAGKRLALTGTPIENRLEDLWSIFRFVAPGYLGPRKEFAERYPTDSDRVRLGLRISPYVLRRTKREVASDLPEKVEVDEWLDLDSDARRIYGEFAQAGLQGLEEIVSKGAASLHLLTVLLRLRQVCLEPALVGGEDGGGSTGVKTRRLLELLEERHQQGKKTLVFSQFVEYLHILNRSAQLPADHVFLLDGSTRNRAELVERFQNSEGSAVFLISLKAGGYGLNLTAADAVVHMDPWWNPAIEAQASDRAHRIGQTQPVTVYRLLARDTVEERVRRIQAAKRAMIEAVQGGSTSGIPAGWTQDDLRSLLQS
ncbi:DEAD/DEAH box helicase [Haloferula helveola]